MSAAIEAIAGLQKTEPLLVALAKAAERHADEDPNGALIKLGQFGEHAVRRVAERASIAWRELGGGTLELIDRLATGGHIPAHATGPLHRLRMSRNRAVHEHWGSTPDVLVGLTDVQELAPWLVDALSDNTGAGVTHDGAAPPESDTLPTVTEVPIRGRGADQSRDRPTPTVLAPEGWPEAAVQVLGLLEDARTLLDEGRRGSSRIAASIEDFRNDMETATAPFRLGVIGEFKAGKSTLINALAGRRLAMTDTVEATATISTYRWGERAEAEFHFVDGRRELASVEAANQLLSERRNDEVWLASIDHVVFTAPSDSLQGVELWDAPGIGGRASNEHLANRFMARISAAVWVLDATLLGSAAIVQPLDQLRAGGKVVIAALNHIDELEPDQVDEALDYLGTTCRDRFASILPISARLAYERTSSGQTDVRLEHLRHAIQERLIDTASDRSELRIERAIANGAARGVGAIRADSHPLTEQLGLLEHIEEGARDATRRTLERLPRYVDKHLDTVWQHDERHVALLFGELEIQLNEKKTEGFKERLDRLWTDAQEMFSRSARTVPARVLDDVRSDWLRLSEENISWTRTSMPELRAGLRTLANDLAVPSPGDEALEHGVAVAAIAGGALAVVAAASAAITWPIVLVALPIGGVEGARRWFQKRAASNDLRPALADSRRSFDEAKAGYRNALLQELIQELTPRIEALLMESSDRTLKEATRKLLQPRTRDEAAALLRQLRRVRDALAKSCPHATDDGLDKVAIPAGAGSTRALRVLLAGDCVRVDIVAASLSDRVILDVLSLVGPDARLRVLTSVPLQEEGALAKSLKNVGNARSGILEVRNLRTVPDGVPVSLGPDMIVTTEQAWCMFGQLGSIGSAEIVASVHSKGRMAAERMFAKRWNGGWLQDSDGLTQNIARTIY